MNGPSDNTPTASVTRAHAAVSQAIKDGRLSSEASCEVCGATQEKRGKWRKVGYHHPDYNEPLFVIPLCQECHTKVHSGMIPEPRTGRYYRHAPLDPDAVRTRVAQVLPTREIAWSTDDLDFFKSYDPSVYRNPPVAIDVVVVDPDLHTVIIRRENPPQHGKLALPGVFLDATEHMIEGCRRALSSKAPSFTEFLARRGWAPEQVHFHALKPFDDLYRDPRFRVLSIPYIAPVPFRWKDAISIQQARVAGLAFDHHRVLARALNFLNHEKWNPEIMSGFFEGAFTMGEYKNLIEAIEGRDWDHSNFHKKVDSLGIVTRHGKWKESVYTFNSSNDPTT